MHVMLVRRGFGHWTEVLKQGQVLSTQEMYSRYERLDSSQPQWRDVEAALTGIHDSVGSDVLAAEDEIPRRWDDRVEEFDRVLRVYHHASRDQERMESTLLSKECAGGRRSRSRSRGRSRSGSESEDRSTSDERSGGDEARRRKKTQSKVRRDEATDRKAAGALFKNYEVVGGSWSLLDGAEPAASGVLQLSDELQDDPPHLASFEGVKFGTREGGQLEEPATVAAALAHIETVVDTMAVAFCQPVWTQSECVLAMPSTAVLRASHPLGVACVCVPQERGRRGGQAEERVQAPAVERRRPAPKVRRRGQVRASRRIARRLAVAGAPLPGPRRREFLRGPRGRHSAVAALQGEGLRPDPEPDEAGCWEPEGANAKRARVRVPRLATPGWRGEAEGGPRARPVLWRPVV